VYALSRFTPEGSVDASACYFSTDAGFTHFGRLATFIFV
jgi:hypothetical protein